MIKIGIVNDLEIALEVLKRVVSSSREYEISWIARDGAEAVSKCAQDLRTCLRTIARRRSSERWLVA